jgi:ribonucleoside-diphosphate reductase beta chain
MKKINLLTPRDYYKPLEYGWAIDLWKQHESMHWLGHEVDMSEDVRDWKEKLNKSEKSLLTHLLRFFTQGDVDVAAGYTTKFLPYFSHKPELAMMMSSFAAREAVHIDAYALLLETLGMPEETYQQFHEYKEMKAKHDYVEQFGMETPEDTLKALAVYSAFTEGMQLFGSFVVLLNFSRFNKMKNMGNIVAWSIRDESLHVEAMTHLFREFKDQVNYPKDMLEEQIKECALTMVDLEDKFMDLIFSEADAIEGLTVDEVKLYVRYIANMRWKQLGFSGKLFDNVAKNPLPWVDYMVNGKEHVNFFEQKATDYSKAMTEGSMGDIEW